MDQLREYFAAVDHDLFFRMDYPDIDIIRVEDTYYCITTTMHFFPGAEILMSKDLIHWKHESYVYETLDSTPGQCLTEGDVYGKGMWAASLRYHEGQFYVCFVANDTGKTYLYRSESIHGPWKKSTIEGFFHDCSLLFDDDGKTYIVYGNRKIFLTELNEDLTAPKEGGLHRLLIEDANNPMLGYEGTTALKINGTYYFFFIHSRSDRWKRVEACFWTDSLCKELTGGDVCDEDLGYKGSGIAQGCIVDTPEGDWYGILFQDRGAAGRMPVLMPVHFEGKQPVFESPMELGKKMPKAAKSGEKIVGTECAKPCGKQADGIVEYKDSFLADTLEAQWQWNHEPDLSLVSFGKEIGGLKLTTGACCDSVLKARNTLTRRLAFPKCEVSVTVDGSEMKEGDVAGLAAFMGSYGTVALERIKEGFRVVMQDYHAPARGQEATLASYRLEESVADAKVALKAVFSFGGEKETVQFYANGAKLGPKKQIFFALDHFTGCRAGLFDYATKETGGSVVFSDFLWKAGE